MNFHLLKLTSYSSLLCEMTVWVICLFICWGFNFEEFLLSSDRIPAL